MVALAVPAVSDSDLRRCDSFVGTAFKFREELQHLGVRKRQELRHDRARHTLVRINPEIGIEQSGPGETAGATSCWSGFGVDVKRHPQAPASNPPHSPATVSAPASSP